MARGGLVALLFLALACGDADVVKDPFSGSGGSAGIGGTSDGGGAGDELIGTLRCPGDGADLLVSYEISELE